MKKLLSLAMVIITLVIIVSCESPLEVKSHELDPAVPSLFNRSELADGQDFSTGYMNGKIRTDRIEFSWSQYPENDFAFYKLTKDNMELGVFKDVTATTFVDTNVVEATSYLYNIIVFADNGMMASDTITIRSAQWQQPSNLVVNGLSNTDVMLTWDDNSDSEEYFRIYLNDLNTRALIDSFTVNRNVTQYTVTDLDPSGNYSFSVKAVSSWEEGTVQSGVIGFDMDQFMLTRPVGLTCVQVMGEGIELIWNDNSTFETGFSVERKMNSGEFAEIAAINEINTVSYIDADTTVYSVGDTLTYRVRAYNDYEGLQYSDYSIERSVVVRDNSFPLVTFHVTCDYYYSECSWNVMDESTQEYIFDSAKTFNTGYQAYNEMLNLPPGFYTVHCWDTSYDGGISGSVYVNDDLATSWSSSNYSSHGTFSFAVSYNRGE